jgi:hypothetical protein
MTRLMLIGLLVTTLACATKSPHAAGEWRRVDDHAEPFEQARSACKAYAMKEAATTTPQGLAAKAAAGAYAECMRERGWALADVE